MSWARDDACVYCNYYCTYIRCFAINSRDLLFPGIVQRYLSGDLPRSIFFSIIDIQIDKKFAVFQRRHAISFGIWQDPVQRWTKLKGYVECLVL